MITVNEDLSIYLTRGDAVAFSVSAEYDNEDYTFQAGDVLRLKVFAKKDCETIVLQKDFPIHEATEEVQITLTEQETRIGETINKPTDYWYEVELNPDNNPQTIIGYDDDGAKVFKLFPEGKEFDVYIPTEDDIPYVDAELDASSPRPVKNLAIARAIIQVNAKLDKSIAEVSGKISDNDTAIRDRLSVIEENLASQQGEINGFIAMPEGATTNDVELANIREDHTGVHHETAGEASRNTARILKTAIRQTELGGTLVSKDWVWENKTIEENGVEAAKEKRLLSPPYRAKYGSRIVVVFSKAQSVLYKQYDYDGNLIGGADWNATGNVVIESAYGIYRFICRNNDDSLITTHSVMVYTNGIVYEDGEIPAPYTLENKSITDDGYFANDKRVCTTPIIAMKGYTTNVSVSSGYSLMVKESDILGNMIRSVADWQATEFNATDMHLVVMVKENVDKKVGAGDCGALKITYTPTPSNLGEDIEFHPQFAVALSNKESKVAHVSSLASGTNGDMFCTYYQDDEHSVEAPTGTNEYIVVNKFKVNNPYEKERLELVKPGGSIGGITFDDQSIREPSMYVSDKVYVLFLAYVSKEPCYYIVSLDKNLGFDSINKCTLDGKNMTTTLGNIIEVDGKYYAGLGGYTSGTHGKIITSEDLINWTTHIELPTSITDGYCMEIAIAYYNEGFHYVVRVQGDSVASNNGIKHLTVDNATGMVLSMDIENSVLSKAALVIHDNGLYCFTNKGGKYEGRKTMKISKLGYDNVFHEVYARKYNPSIHYFSVANYGGDLYMTFSSGVNKINDRDSIMFAPIEFNTKEIMR